jgi:hypothetical protein
MPCFSTSRCLTSKIKEEDLLNYLERTLEVLTKVKTIPESALFLLLSITKVFLNVNFKTKKLIMKMFLTNSFLKFFEKDPNVIYILIAFLAKISEQAVYNLTIGKVLKTEFETTDFAENWVLQKILSVLLAPELDKRISADKTFYYNENIANLLNINGICASEKFKDHVDYLALYTLGGVESLPTSNTIIKTSSENQNFSSLIGSLFEFLMKSEFIRKRIHAVLIEVLPVLLFKDHVFSERQGRGGRVHVQQQRASLGEEADPEPQGDNRGKQKRARGSSRAPPAEHREQSRFLPKLEGHIHHHSHT